MAWAWDVRAGVHGWGWGAMSKNQILSAYAKLVLHVTSTDITSL